MAATRQQVIEQARSYLGVRFRHQGRTREQGLDCFGLVIRVCHDLGLSAFEWMGYGRDPDPREVMRVGEEQLHRIYWPEVQAGDVVLMAWGSWPCHVAILADKAHPFSLIHAYAGARKVCEIRMDAQLQQAICGCFRLPNIQEAA